MGPEFVESFNGEVIFKCLPVVQVTSWENRLKVCSNCLKLVDIAIAIKCENCNSTVYCNPSCMEQDDMNHIHECRKMQKLMEQTELIRLTLRYLVRHGHENKEEFCSLKTISDVRYECFYKILGMIAGDINLPRYEFFNIFENIQQNCLTVFGPHDRPLGFAVYNNISSKLEHSCVPNADLSFSESQLQIVSRVNRRLKDKDNILISYVDKRLSTKEKGKELKMLFNKDCSCYKCSELEVIKKKISLVFQDNLNILQRNFAEDVENLTEGKNRDYFYSIRCQDCHEGWPIPVGDKYESLSCGLCEEVLDEEVVQKYFKLKNEFLLARIDNIDIALRLMNNIFPVFHPYDLHFIALSQVTLHLSLKYDHQIESKQIASLLSDVLQQLIPDSEANKEIKFIHRYLSRLFQ